MVIILKAKKDYGRLSVEQAISLIHDIQAEHPNITACAMADERVIIKTT